MTGASCQAPHFSDFDKYLPGIQSVEVSCPNKIEENTLAFKKVANHLPLVTAYRPFGLYLKGPSVKFDPGTLPVRNSLFSWTSGYYSH